MSELKPCPFCGSGRDDNRAISIMRAGLWYIYCNECKASQGDYKTREDAINAWNTRYERTCHNLYCEGSDLGEGGFRCSRCDGEMYGDEPNYCCHCGAKVVSA